LVRELRASEEARFKTTTVRRALLTLLCLMSFAASAHAECAWVLWQETQTAKIDETVVSEIQVAFAFETKQACDRSLKDVLDKMRTVKGAVVTPSQVIVPSTITRYVCLPDTVDPRGPKGK